MIRFAAQDHTLGDALCDEHDLAHARGALARAAHPRQARLCHALPGPRARDGAGVA